MTHLYTILLCIAAWYALVRMLSLLLAMGREHDARLAEARRRAQAAQVEAAEKLPRVERPSKPLSVHPERLERMFAEGGRN